MSNPPHMRAWGLPLAEGARVYVYSDSARILLQIRRTVATEQDVLAPSFKVAVCLAPVDALALAGELLNVASSILKRSQGEELLEDPGPGEPAEEGEV